MIEPIRSGAELVAEVAATSTGEGALAIWWLGQSGFLTRGRGGTLVVDPYLSEHLTRKYEGTGRPHVRMTRAPIRGGELSGVDLVVASHKHSDHLDPGTLPDLLSRASPTARLIVPSSLLDHARAMGLPGGRTVGLTAGETFEG